MLPPADHRPWPPPDRPWVMTQTWHDLLFAHWPIPVAALRDAVPPALTVDTADGHAWIGVVPFHMTVRLRRCPPLPGTSAFPEINVRTYVTVAGKPGIFFLSLDAPSPVAVAVARRWYCLPYHRARITVERRGERILYESRRAGRGASPAEFAGAYGPSGEVFRARPGSLEYWLTERYCLYALDRRGRLCRGEIHHAPWPLQAAEAEIERNTMAAARGIRLPDTAPLLHSAKRLTAVFWPLAPVGKSEA